MAKNPNQERVIQEALSKCDTLCKAQFDCIALQGYLSPLTVEWDNMTVACLYLSGRHDALMAHIYRVLHIDMEG